MTPKQQYTNGSGMYTLALQMLAGDRISFEMFERLRDEAIEMMEDARAHMVIGPL